MESIESCTLKTCNFLRLFEISNQTTNNQNKFQALLKTSIGRSSMDFIATVLSIMTTLLRHLNHFGGKLN
jgi:hypothetical protein